VKAKLIRAAYGLLPLVLAASMATVPAAPAAADPASPVGDGRAPLSATADAPDSHTGVRTPLSDRAPVPASDDHLRSAPETKAAPLAVPNCSVSDFTSRTGTALVQFIESTTTDCVNTLFSLSGNDAYLAFREAQMASVAYGYRDNALYYDGTNNAGTTQLVLYLRAGYYVQFYAPGTVGQYGPALKTATRAALDAFFANGRSGDVNDVNGETLAESVTLIDSADENIRYLYVVKRLLGAYNSGYDGYWWMVNAVNNVYYVLFAGHSLTGFGAAVQADPSVLDALYNFGIRWTSLLGGDNTYLDSNAGLELGRFLQYGGLQSKVRPQVRGLLDASALTGRTAPLWIAAASSTYYYDNANCSYYGTCDLKTRVAAEVLPINHTCSATLRIRAQQMSAAELSSSCTSLADQDAYFHNLVNDPGPVSGDRNTSLETVVFDSSTDYQTYAGILFDIDTDNGGMYLEGDPSATGNVPRFIAYEAEWVRPVFQIWNLNHEYTHYLDGRFNMYGDFSAGMTTPTVWWVEGFAEYVSYGYRNVAYTAAITEAGKGTYALSTLFDTTYENADSTRVYSWGYLAARYMMQSHRADMTTVLGHYRSGNWQAARTYLKSTIGTRYDADWRTWLAACAAGSCGGTTPGTGPTADFTYTASGLTVAFTDRSTDTDGSIATRAWDFGDGTTSTSANPSKTYTAGSYNVRLTVTDNSGLSASITKTVTVGSGGGDLPTCTGTDTRTLGKNCQRSGLSATAGNYSYLYLTIPAGTTRLTITSTGGSGNCDLYYSATGWATTSSYNQRSTASGNTETITVNNPAAGYHYVSLYATSACAGVTVRTQF